MKKGKHENQNVLFGDISPPANNSVPSKAVKPRGKVDLISNAGDRGGLESLRLNLPDCEVCGLTNGGILSHRSLKHKFGNITIGYHCCRRCYDKN